MGMVSRIKQHNCDVQKVKILMLGDSGVGKTCVLLRFVDDTFQETFISTFGIDFKIKTFEIDGKKVRLQIWDTVGQERFHSITRQYYQGADGIMLVFDVTNERSFDNIKQWLKTIDTDIPSDKHVEKLLVGNKCDLESERVVPYETVQKMAEAQNISYIETSAKTKQNIDKAFDMLAKQIVKRIKDKQETEHQDDVLHLQQQQQQQQQQTVDKNKNCSC